jgi:c-di-GMP-binding flagellar brake protein YcgR
MMIDPENRRSYFRLALDLVPATMTILEVGQRPITTNPRAVQILNASGGGLYIRAEEDLPVRRGVIGQFEFGLGAFTFSFRGVLLRKLDDRVSYKYGIEFIDVDEYQRGLLVSAVGRMQVEQSKAGG